MSRPRTISPDKVRILRQWKPFNQLCKELGINPKTGAFARNYVFKTPYEGTDIHSAKVSGR